jgi:hypothetical protein
LSTPSSQVPFSDTQPFSVSTVTLESGELLAADDGHRRDDRGGVAGHGE